MVDFRGNEVDFLSKCGFYTTTGLQLARIPVRAINSGSVTNKNISIKEASGNKGYNLSFWAQGIALMAEFAD